MIELSSLSLFCIIVFRTRSCLCVILVRLAIYLEGCFGLWGVLFSGRKKESRIRFAYSHLVIVVFLAVVVVV